MGPNDYSPPWAKHVVGTPEGSHPIKILLKCTHCGQTHFAFCESGLWRRHVQNYAKSHARCVANG
jgi:hypothetical protein